MPKPREGDAWLAVRYGVAVAYPIGMGCASIDKYTARLTRVWGSSESIRRVCKTRQGRRVMRTPVVADPALAEVTSRRFNLLTGPRNQVTDRLFRAIVNVTTLIATM